jgi:hypothetical protein
VVVAPSLTVAVESVLAGCPLDDLISSTDRDRGTCAR